MVVNYRPHSTSLIMAKLLAASVVVLFSGCSDALSGRVAVETPPPKPPNCPSSFNLSDFASTREKIIDVRIIQFNGEKLYFPASWLQEYYIDKFHEERNVSNKKNELSDTPISPDAGRFLPDLHLFECPATVHRLNEDWTMVSYLEIPVLKDGKAADKNFSSNSNVSSIIMSTGYRGKGLASLIENVVAMEDTIDGLEVYAKYETKGAVYHKPTSRSFSDLIEWLRTPPNDRVNDRVFSIKIDEGSKP
jgi:hypothetical protein